MDNDDDDANAGGSARQATATRASTRSRQEDTVSKERVRFIWKSGVDHDVCDGVVHSGTVVTQDPDQGVLVDGAACAHPDGSSKAWRAWIPSDDILPDVIHVAACVSAQDDAAPCAKRQREAAEEFARTKSQRVERSTDIGEETVTNGDAAAAPCEAPAAAGGAAGGAACSMAALPSPLASIEGEGGAAVRPIHPSVDCDGDDEDLIQARVLQPPALGRAAAEESGGTLSIATAPPPATHSVPSNVLFVNSAPSQSPPAVSGTTACGSLVITISAQPDASAAPSAAAAATTTAASGEHNYFDLMLDTPLADDKGRASGLGGGGGGWRAADAVVRRTATAARLRVAQLLGARLRGAFVRARWGGLVDEARQVGRATLLTKRATTAAAPTWGFPVMQQPSAGFDGSGGGGGGGGSAPRPLDDYPPLPGFETAASDAYGRFPSPQQCVQPPLPDLLRAPHSHAPLPLQPGLGGYPPPSLPSRGVGGGGAYDNGGAASFGHAPPPPGPPGGLRFHYAADHHPPGDATIPAGVAPVAYQLPPNGQAPYHHHPPPPPFYGGYHGGGAPLPPDAYGLGGGGYYSYDPCGGAPPGLYGLPPGSLYHPDPHGGGAMAPPGCHGAHDRGAMPPAAAPGVPFGFPPPQQLPYRVLPSGEAQYPRHDTAAAPSAFISPEEWRCRMQRASMMDTPSPGAEQPARAPSTVLQAGGPRKGKWSSPEEDYAMRLIMLHNMGWLRLDDVRRTRLATTLALCRLV